MSLDGREGPLPIFGAIWFFFLECESRVTIGVGDLVDENAKGKWRNSKVSIGTTKCWVSMLTCPDFFDIIILDS